MAPLPKGSCRYFRSGTITESETRRRRRQRLEPIENPANDVSRERLALIVDQTTHDDGSAILCQWSHGDAASDNGEVVISDNSDISDRLLVVYDDHIRIVSTTIPSTGSYLKSEERNQAVSNFVDELKNSNPWWSLKAALQQDIEQYRRRGSSKTDNDSNRYASLCKPKSPPSDGPFMIPFTPESGIFPLQTLVISIVYSQATTTLSSSTSGISNVSRIDALLHACWKRQLAGKVIMYGGDLTSTIRLRTPSTSLKGETSLGVESESSVIGVIDTITITPIDNRYTGTKSQNSNLPKLCLILPTTRITVRQTTGATSIQESGSSSSNHRGDSTEPPSVAARLLIETIDCIRARRNVPRNFLLSGPPGVGKTFSVTWAWKYAMSSSSNFPAGKGRITLRSLRGSELLQNVNPAHALEREFLTAVQLANHDTKVDADIDANDQQDDNSNNDVNPVALIFLDEFDALVSVAPVAAMLAYLMDRVEAAEDPEWTSILIVGATNRIGSIPSFLRRSGRFDREIHMDPPNGRERFTLLSTLLAQATQTSSTSDSRLEITDEELHDIAEKCVGYVPADLSSLLRKAWLLSIRKQNDVVVVSSSSGKITHAALDAARDLVGASALRDASLAAPPKMSWDDIAGDPGGAKTALRQAIEWPRLKAKQFAILGLDPPRGILLHGPPGCAKTTLARAAAGASGVAFLSLSPAQVYASSYVGEAEAVVRRAFVLARSAAPCILFFDEIDSIFGGNGDNGNGMDGAATGGGRGNSAEARVLSTFLNEMDGVDITGAGKDGVLVLGATNRPWTLDSALLRPGRLGDKVIFLPPPDDAARRAIIEMQFSRRYVDEDDHGGINEWDWDHLIPLSDGMTGAEVLGACQDAKMRWIRETVLMQDELSMTAPIGGQNDNVTFPQSFLVDALSSIKPLLSDPLALQEFRLFQSRDMKYS
jgi:SpoVK/Ycf46/Vps4 family AAA+-type ATPase